MSELRHSFGELRSLTAARPSAQAWEALLHKLEPLEQDPELPDHLPYLDAALQRWPDALRAATDAQLDRLERGEHPGALWPLVRALKLSGHARQQHQIAAILAHEATHTLPSLLLTTTPQPLDRWLDHLAPRAALRQLQLGFNTLQRDQLGPLLEAARWDALHALELSWTPDVLDGADHALTHGAALTNLRTLSLAWCRLSEPCIAALSHAALPALEALDLEHCRLTDTRAAHLLRAMDLPALHTLTLDNNALGDATIAALAQPHHLPALRALNMSGADLTHDQMVTLLRSPGAARLSRLDLRHSGDPTRHAELSALAPPRCHLLLRR
jgi:hypothetical protein